AVLAEGFGYDTRSGLQGVVEPGSVRLRKNSRDVRPAARMNSGGSVVEGFFDMDHGWQGVDLDVDGLDRVLGLVPRVGHHHGYGLAYVTNVALGQHPERPGRPDLGTLEVDPPLAHEVVQVRCDEHCRYAGHGGGRPRIDREDGSPGGVAAHEGGVKR